MLSYEKAHKEVHYYESLTEGQKPARLNVYVRNDNYALQQIPASEFNNYKFIGYTYDKSFYPVVQKVK